MIAGIWRTVWSGACKRAGNHAGQVNICKARASTRFLLFLRARCGTVIRGCGPWTTKNTEEPLGTLLHSKMEPLSKTGASAGGGTFTVSEEREPPANRRVKRSTVIIACMTLVVLLVAAIALLVVYYKPQGHQGQAGVSASEFPRFCDWPRDDAPGADKCYQKLDSFGYKVVSGKVEDDKQDSEIQLKFSTELDTPPVSDVIRNVTLSVTKLNNNTLRIKMYDSDNQRYEVPVQDNFTLLDEQHSADNPAYTVEQGVTPKGYFSFTVKRKDSETIILDTSVGNMVLADQLLQFVTKLATKNVYGFGENPHVSYRHKFDSTTWPMFARDEGPDEPPKNVYGVHPFWMCLEKDGKAHGVLLLNSNAMEYTFHPDQILQLVSIGGILDFFVFVGDGPNHVVELYTDLIGKPFLPPYWALGFQLSRYGYNSVANLTQVLDRNHAANIPQDVQHIDIDYMHERIDFTIDPVDFAGLQETLSRYTERGLKIVTIFDPAIIANRSGYDTYKRGFHQDVYIKWPSDVTNENRSNPWNDEVTMDVMYGQVWPPGPVAFPDFFKDSTGVWWEQEIASFLKSLTFHAIWIDMNEPADFSTNMFIPTLCNKKRAEDNECWRLRCPKNRYDDPPYATAAATQYGEKNRLRDKTICMVGVQGDRNQYRHYDVHNLYGWSQAVATHKVINNVFPERSFVLSRSTYVSSGRYAGHWLGDNLSRWTDMHRSIIGMLEFNMFGIPYVGADICGFFGEPTPELCTRWMQLGAFYPFSRNHNFIGDPSQDPASFEADIQNIMRDALKVRYSLLPYLYTLFYHAHTRGTPVVRALLNEFPKDEKTYDIDRQFMWGGSLLISPILEEGQKEITYYLPEGRWYDFYSVYSTLFDRVKCNSPTEPNSRRII
ncbi:maltase-glucoamylase-like isoform X2 [Ornithodoros turicata]|uniref:maltase-glucoamylase-like isoform X2 n=1 Tax=Ornithodoros turicata TaxID=34597 RepID=UPI0031392B98